MTKFLPILLTAGLLICTSKEAASVPAAPAPPLVHKNPLDVELDENGKTARVALMGEKKFIVIDLDTEEVLTVEGWPFSAPDVVKPQWGGPAATTGDQKIRKYEIANQIEELEGFYNKQGVWHERDFTLIAHQTISSHGKPDFRNSFSKITEKTGKAALSARERERLEAFEAIKKEYPPHITEAIRGFLVKPYSMPGGGGSMQGGWSPQIKGQSIETTTLDQPGKGFADPAVILRSKRHESTAYVACAGADCVVKINLNSGEELRQVATQSNPRRMAISSDGGTLVVSNYLSDSLTVIDIEASEFKLKKHIQLGGPKPDAVRRGEILFHSAKPMGKGKFTCATCHPHGGTDNLNWDLPRDGGGNPKNTKSLLGVKDTAPFGWHGTSTTLADRVKGTLETLHDYKPTEEEVRDLTSYLESLPAPAPLHVHAYDKPAHERGMALFQGKAGCASCHKGDTLQDGKSHDIGTGLYADENRINTPSLRGVSGTAPYLHHGKAAKLEEIFEPTFNGKKRHGRAHQLTSEEMTDLMAYLKAL